MKSLKLISLAVALTASLSLSAQIAYRPYPNEWGSLIKGGQFLDRILPLPAGKLSMDNWGAGCVQPRYIDNGIEDNKISYWGGNITEDSDGKYHMFVSGWYENNPRGHMGWYDASYVFHAVANNSIGPFVVQDTLGAGHNTELVKLSNGKFMVYHISGREKGEQNDCCYYLSSSLNGPWTKHLLPWDLRGRNRTDGVGGTSNGNWYHNMSFATRKDGSVVMVTRGGKICISKTGTSTYNMVTDDSVYPFVDGRYEDPVIWRDDIQYHMIVNDWLGRTAFYLRSKEGINWVVDSGVAYQPGVVRHKDGRVENWFKYERARVLQDEHGRVVQLNFAVCDTLKHEDLPNDNYSSKNISIPMNKGLLLEMLNTAPISRSTKEIKVKILSEEGFDPNSDIELSSLRFGTSSEVDYGRGAVAISSEKVADGMVVTFKAKEHCITGSEFAPKLLGTTTSAEMVYGYCSLPWVDYSPAILSALPPKVKGGDIVVEVENFGLSTSKDALLTLSVFGSNGVEEQIAASVVPPIKPYGKSQVVLKLSKTKTPMPKAKSSIVIKILSATEPAAIFRTKL